MKILVIGPSWVGDMVMSHSLYQELKGTYPNCQIDVLAPAWCKPILERMSEVSQAIEMPIGHGRFDLGGRWKIARQLAHNHYTHAIVLPNSAKSALIPLFAGIKSRIGWKGEFRYGLLNDLRKDKRVFQYMVERYVALAYPNPSMLESVSIERCRYPKLNIDQASQLAALEKLSVNQDRPIIGLCPGAEFGPAKRWPDRYYATIARQLIQRGYQVWIFGSSKDHSVAELIRTSLSPENQQQCHNLAGRTTLVEVIDLLALCDTVLSNDSGLMHISAAVGCKVVAIYGSSSPKYTPPLTDKLAMVHTDVACRPCFQRECPLGHLDCLEQLTPDLVMAAADKFIGH